MLDWTQHFKNMFAAKIPVEGRNITNHSGKVTLCTNLFKTGFDDIIIRQRSGHRSDTVKTQNTQTPR